MNRRIGDGPPETPVDGFSSPVSRDGSPALVGANWYRFTPDERIHHPHVASVCFVWVVQGEGVIRVDGQGFDMAVDSVLRLPWRHSVEYLPDRRAPFSVGTIHLVPWHAADVPVETRTAHQPGDPLLDADYRRGPDQRQDPALLPGRTSVGRNIIALGSYGIELFLEGRVVESTSRALGSLITGEDALWEETRGSRPLTAPALEIMTEFVLANLDAGLSVSQVAAAGHCSSVTAQRLFTRYTGLSVQGWVRDQRMKRAAVLLRTRSMTVREVARMVGFTDPFYFSRVFTATYSVPPSRYTTGSLKP